ncbi:acyltransferase 3 [Echria macrotheca]|uniref:Acyltransferase 3 n=1 Tax=Echria macrotheca TaxID=438768 RepID=A0AAJ0B4X0_9PEZI|nr:acyltransferase 3 [Echria macrotheca]
MPKNSSMRYAQLRWKNDREQRRRFSPSLLRYCRLRLPENLCDTAFKAFGFLIPSFLRPDQWTSEVPLAKKTSSQTSWLNGLRGVAALFVVCHHSTLLLFSWDIHRAYRSTSDHIIQLPILRLIVSGLPQVCIFFVVSGYSISLTALSHISARRYDDLQRSLASSLVRCHSRLFVPAISVALMTALWSHWGLFAEENWSDVPAFPSRPVPRDDSLWRQLLDWARRSIKHADPMQNSIHDTKGFAYDIDQWTIPLEFAGSMVVYLLLAALSRFRTVMRLSILVGVMAWQLIVSTSWVAFLFVGGMFLADLDIFISNSNRKAESTLTRPAHHLRSLRSRILRHIRNFLWTLLLLLSLYLLSAPEINLGPKDGLSAPGYQSFQSLIPTSYWEMGKEDYFLIPIGAFLLILCVSRCSLLQRPFTTSFALYLGRISYSLYLVHGPLLYTFGAWLAGKVARVPGGDGEHTGGFLHPGLVYIAFWPLAMWWADVVCCGVDEPVVSGLRILWERLEFKG